MMRESQCDSGSMNKECLSPFQVQVETSTLEGHAQFVRIIEDLYYFEALSVGQNPCGG